MAIPAERLAALKLYCRIDGDSEDALLGSLHDAAVGYLREAGVSVPSSGERKAQYDLCVNALVLDSYDRRGATTQEAHAIADDPMFRRMLNQLKLTEPREAIPV